MSKVINFQVVQHGFARIGVCPLSTINCLKCCDKETLKLFNKECLDNMVAKVTNLVEKFHQEGQITEADMDAAEIPRAITEDKRTTEKDCRRQSNQRAVLLSCSATHERRQDWIQSHRKVTQEQSQIGDLAPKNTTGILPEVRKRKPNRSSSVISAERAEKNARKLAKLGHFPLRDYLMCTLQSKHKSQQIAILTYH